MPEIDGQTAVCGLIGNPVEHTMSPVIHNTLAALENRKLVYVPFPVREGGLGAAVEGARALNILGLNITVPYKREVLPCLSDVDETAGRIGAVNTLVRTPDGYRGYNTDMTGLYRALCAEHISLKGESVLLLGAGGAARAVAFMCAFHEAAELFILNRTVDKAKGLAEEINRAAGRVCAYALSTEDWNRLPQRSFLAIQATSVGLSPHTEEAVISEPGFYEKIHTGFDLIYRPLETRFMSLVRQNGGRACNGLKMLLYQGIIAYELWNRVSVTEEDALTVFRRMKEAMGITV